ncbi:MAG: hypothetical protein MJ215_05585 [Spirochaetia bacterium]|nr:hypothetical protein [Spirochaetia bacterium]
MKRICLLFITVIFISCTRCTNFHDEKAPEYVSVMSFNTENLCDGTHQGTEYAQFDPDSGSWTEKDYRARLLQLSRTIKEAGEKVPDIIAFQEIENQGVLKELTKGYLSGCGYKYIVISSNSDSAIQSGFISRYPYDYVRYHTPYLSAYGNQREIIEAAFNIHGHRLIIFNNHWKSKLGDETEMQRLFSADTLSARISAIMEQYPKAEILLLGDFNECADEYIRTGKKAATAIMPADSQKKAIYQSIYITGDANNRDSRIFFSPWLTEQHTGTGSYFYRSSWETIDNFFLNSNLTDNDGFCFRNFRTVQTQWNTNSDGYPMSFNKKTATGCSDHFPILLELNLKD